MGRRSERSHRGAVVSCVIKINGGAAVWMEPLGAGPGGCNVIVLSQFVTFSWELFQSAAAAEGPTDHFFFYYFKGGISSIQTE